RIFLSIVDGGFSGVPGAFLSVLIQSLLNQIVNDSMTTDPHLVLAHLQDKLTHLFEQEESAIVRSQAGIGVAFLSLTKNLRSLRFSGANISLYKQKYDKLQEFPGDELPLGLENHNFSPKQFTQHTIQVGLGDTFYLFTNGITQQKNGQGEMLGKQRLLEFFIKHSQATIEEQIRLVRQFLDKWRGNATLTEDELLICFRI
ncbi:MAG: serine/threonine-protein phosphatase, partial [Bacteroidia bacterium]|nr:serine/threonine-protein phosphatase [Bacteroidia bacterium]